MDFELYPAITLREGSFNVLVAPRAGPEGCLGQMAEGVQGAEERGSGSRAEARGDCEEAFQ